MGIDYRVVNGYIYISGNPVTDPAKIAERAEFFQRRAGYYFAELGAALRALAREGAGADRRGHDDAPVPDLPEYEPDEVMLDDERNSAFIDLLDAYQRTLRLGELMWQQHFEFLLLGYGAYATFADFCKANLPDIPDQHIAQMVAGIDVILFRPGRRAAAARAAGARDAASTAPSSRADRRARSRPSSRAARPAAPGSASSRRSRTRGSTWPPATASPTTTAAGSTTRAIPYASIIGHIARCARASRSSARPRRSSASASASRSDYRELLDEQARGAFDELLKLSRTVFPYVEEHKFYCDYWFLTRWWNKLREFGALLARHGYLEDRRTSSSSARHEVAAALDELVLMWATGGEPLGPHHWPPIVARRKQLLARLGEWTPPPALGVAPEAVTDPMTIMLWGVTTQRVQEWARAAGRRHRRADRRRGLAGHSRGPRARDQDGRRDRGRARGRDPRLHDHLAGVGADLLEDQGGGDRHRRRDVARGDRLPRVRAAGGRRHRSRHRRRSAPARRSASTAHDGVVTILDARRVSGSRRRTRGRSPSCARRTRRASAARARASASCSAAGIPVPGGFAVAADAYNAFVDEAGLAGRIEAAVGRRDRRRQRARRRRLATRSPRSCAPRRCPRRCARSRRSLRASSRPPASRRWRCARARSARTARTRPSPGSRRATCGCAAPARSATRCATAGSASTARRRSPTARACSARGAVAMGVTVQLMVDAAVSGVMFTCNPVSGDPSIVAINASWGLGLAVVGGEVTPDDYLVSKVTGEVVREPCRPRTSSTSPDATAAARCARGVRASARRACLDERASGRARRARAHRRAPLRLPSGHRVGDRPRTARRCSSSSHGRSRRWPSPPRRPAARRRSRW